MTTIICPHCGKVAATVSSVVEDDAGALQAGVTLSSPIEIHPWPTRIQNAFNHFRRLKEVDGDYVYVEAPIKTFADLCSVADYELMRHPNLGQTSVAQVKQVLARYGLQLAET